MFTRYTNGAEQEAEIVTRYELGAEVEAEAVYAYKNGAEEEVWGSMDWFTEQSNNIEYAMLQITDNGTNMNLWKWMDGTEGGSLSGGGTIVFVLDGEWTNPTIEFDWEGEMFRYNVQNTTWYTASAGSVSLYVKQGNITRTMDAVPSIGDTRSGTEGVDQIPDTPSGTFSMQLSGTYTQLGLSIFFRGWNGTYYRASSDIFVKNVKIDGKVIGFPESSEFDNLEW